MSKQDYINIWTNMYGTASTQWVSINDGISFAPYPTPQACTVPCAPTPKVSNKKEKTMYVDNDKHIESSKINYLSDRADRVFYDKIDSLPKQFGLSDDDAPRSVADFIKRIQDGKYVVKDESKKDIEGFYYRPYEGIRWRDPSVKEDTAGYKAAQAALKAIRQDVKDAIAISTPAEALAAIKTMEAWTPTAK